MSWWEDFITDYGEPIANAAGAAITAGIANKGASDYEDAVRGANTDALNLTRDIYRDQTARSEPWRQSGVNALNFQNLWLGMPQVKDQGGGNNLWTASDGSTILPNLGAGQPVPGHSGGFNGNPVASGIGGGLGAGIGSIFGPVGSKIGGALGSAAGGMIRSSGPEGDRWKTIATQAPQGYAYDEYFNSSPEFAREWAKPDVQALFGGNRDAYIYWHANGGQMNGQQSWAPNQDWLNRGAASIAAGSQAPAAGQTPGQAPGTPDLWSTIKNNPLYVAATDGFLGVDTPQIEGAYATGGQALSGAEKKALHDRGVARSYNALGDIWNQYGTLSGTGQTAVGQQNAAGGAYAAGATPIIRDSGEVAGKAGAARNANWATAADNALGGIYSFGKSKGWIQ